MCELHRAGKTEIGEHGKNQPIGWAGGKQEANGWRKEKDITNHGGVARSKVIPKGKLQKSDGSRRR